MLFFRLEEQVEGVVKEGGGGGGDSGANADANANGNDA
jgi:hypothetical protein